MATLYVPDTLGGFDRAAYQASEGCYIAGAYATCLLYTSRCV